MADLAPYSGESAAVSFGPYRLFPAQRADLKFEIALVDMGIGPDPRHQLVPADNFARMLDQGDQHIERAATETNRFVALQQQSLCW